DGAKGGLIGTSNVTVRTSKTPPNFGGVLFSAPRQEEARAADRRASTQPAQHRIGCALSKARTRFARATGSSNPCTQSKRLLASRHCRLAEPGSGGSPFEHDPCHVAPVHRSAPFQYPVPVVIQGRF